MLTFIKNMIFGPPPVESKYKPPPAPEEAQQLAVQRLEETWNDMYQLKHLMDPKIFRRFEYAYADKDWNTLVRLLTDYVGEEVYLKEQCELYSKMTNLFEKVSIRNLDLAVAQAQIEGKPTYNIIDPRIKASRLYEG